MLPEAMSRPATPKVHYLKSRRWLSIIGVAWIALGLLEFVFLTGVAVLTGIFNGIGVLTLLLGIFMLGIGVLYLWMAQTVYISTSPDGLKYNNMGLYSIETSWANIDHVGPVKMRLLGSQQCIVLREPVHLGWLSRLAWALPKEQLERTIPLPSGWDKRDDLIQDIKFYAPNVSGL